MKRITQLTTQNKKDISICTKNLIDTVFKGPIKEKQVLLEKVISFSQDKTCSEPVLQQTLLKGCFPKVTWQKQLMLQKAQVSPKIVILHPKEVSDVRFLTEINISDKFANSSTLIEKIIFNSENPQVAVAKVSSTNMYKDININFTVAQQNLSITADIKCGNNAYEAFKGILGVLPVTDNYQPYSIINKTAFTLEKLQQQRILFLERCADYTHDTRLRFSLEKIKEIVGTSQQSLMDPILINTLIQDELLHCVALNVLQKQPSFFTPHKIATVDFNEKYFKALEPYIKENIFDNKENFNQFMAKALRIYHDHITDISTNVTNNFWKDTGFENIADDIFK